MNADPDHPMVMVVDDDGAILRALGLRLEQAKFKPILTLDGAEAIAIARKAPPAAIILDLRMPVIDGFTVLEKLQACKVTAGIPAIILSADGAEKARLRALKGGATFFVEKPYRCEDLLAALKTAVGSREAISLKFQHSEGIRCL